MDAPKQMTPCTVVSMMPFEVNTAKPQVVADMVSSNENGAYLPAVEKGKMVTLQIRSCTRPYYVDYDRGNIQIPTDPEEVARSIVQDEIRSSLYVSSGAQPALFYVHGLKSKEQIAREHVREVEEALKQQIAWFNRILKAADDVWQRFRQHRTLSTIHVTAAKWLNVKREWAEDAVAASNVQCDYCQSLISEKAVVCPICRLPQASTVSKLPDHVRAIIFGNQPIPVPAKPA